MTEETSVHELKVLVANELDIPVERQRLVFKGKPMHGTFVYVCCVCMYVSVQLRSNWKSLVS